MSTENDVRKASEKFYAALNNMLNGNAGSMTDIWSHNPSVTSMHPIGGREIGWDAVKASFEKVAQLASKGKVELNDQLICANGDVACEVGVEQGQLTLAGHQVNIEHRVTNVYQRKNGAWKMIHHHTDTSPAMMKVISEL